MYYCTVTVQRELLPRSHKEAVWSLIMKRIDINITDSANVFLEGLKKRTEKSKTELIHDAIGLLSLAEKAYSANHELAEIDPATMEVVSRFVMPLFGSIEPAPMLVTTLTPIGAQDGIVKAAVAAHLAGQTGGVEAAAAAQAGTVEAAAAAAAR